RLQKEVGVTTVFVTHDQSEALALSDEIAVMNEGEIIQIGAPRAIYNRPNSRFVATFVGSTNLLPGTVLTPPRGEEGVVGTAVGPYRCVFAGMAPTAKEALVSVRPENVTSARRGTAGAEGTNVLPGRIR